MQSAITTNSNGPAIEWLGGAGTFAARGTFGGATIQMQYCPRGADPADSTNWADVENVSLTAVGQRNFSLGRGLVRAVVSSVSTTSITYGFIGFLGGPRGYS